MSFLKSWFIDRGAAPPSPLSPEAPQGPESPLLPESAPISLPRLMDALRGALGELSADALDTDVVRAKLADICRGLSITPLDPLAFEQLTADLDRGAWDRMGLLVLVLESGAIGDSLGRALSGRARSAVRGGLIEASKGSPLLTLELLRAAPLRLEELARRFILGLGASVEGEALVDSKRALERLDYSRLLAEADRAKRAAAERSGRDG